MAVTTRDYNITESNPTNILRALHDAITDLGWFEPQPYGYLTAFTSSPGSTISSQVNKRYLLTPTSLSIGANSAFDVLRNAAGQIASITLVTGGENYDIITRVGTSSSGTSISVGDTDRIVPGMIVVKTAGTGTLLTNTQVVSVANSTHITVDRAPSPALSSASIYFQDVLTIPANTIGGGSVNVAATGVSGQNILKVSSEDAVKINVGQRVIGTNIPPLAFVSIAYSNTIVISQASIGTVSSNLTFSDEITCLVTGAVNANNLFGTANGNTITNVVTNTNLFVGSEITLLSGDPQFLDSNGRAIIGSITGAGPFTINLRNRENTFSGFNSNGNITFKSSSGPDENWFNLDRYTSPTTFAWGVAKIKNSNDLLGCTFWQFFVSLTGQQPTLTIRPMAGYNPAGAVAQGVANFDWAGAAAITTVTGATYGNVIGSMFNTPLTLRTRQSGVDPNFVTFSFFDGNTNRNPFFISKYNNNLQPWNLNDTFLGAAYEIFQLPTYATNDGGISFRTRVNGLARRMSESGYTTYLISATAAYVTPYYRSTSGNRLQGAPVAVGADVSFYLRQEFDIQSGINDGIKIFKNIPINPLWYPVSYYLPEDFGVVEVPWKGPVVRDTITVSPSEVWTIVQTGQNQVTFTTMCLVARTT
jgi:hypothetical protein